MSDLPDGDSISDYRLLRLLGTGAAGRVYLATPTREKGFSRPGEPLAVKVYKSEILDRPHQLDRIRREFQVGSDVHHPRLVRMYEHSLGERGTRPFLVMEYVDGFSLDSWLRMFHPVSGRLRLRIFTQIVEGVRALHHSSVVHRDLKPQNIMITPAFDAQVMDLGVVWTWRDPPITPADDFLGSIRNSSPEMLFGDKYDLSTDLYSLGTILYALLHGDQVFAEEKQFARLVSLVQGQEPTFDVGIAAQDEISERLLALCRELLQKKPEGRPASSDVLAQTLAEIGNLAPVREPFEPLHGYVATALTGLEGAKRDAVHFAANLIADTAKEFDVYVYQPRRFTDPLLHEKVTPEAVYLQDRRRVLSADVVFLLLNEPSFGVGQELEIAAGFGKPVILVSRVGIRVSRMVRGSFGNLVGEIEYSTPEELVRQVRKLLGMSAEGLHRWKRRQSRVIPGLAPQLRQWRLQANFPSAHEFADALGLSPRIIEALEQGEHENIGMQLLSFICSALGRSVSELFVGGTSADRGPEEDSNLLTLEQLAREIPFTARDFLELRDQYKHELAAAGEPFQIDRAGWWVRYEQLERRRFEEGGQEPLL